MVSKPTLGISLSTRLTGMAVIAGSNLIDYAVRLNKEKWSAAKAQTIIASLQSCCANYSIELVVLSIPYDYHQTQTLVSFIETLSDALRKNHVPFRTYTVQEVLSYFSQKEKETKKILQETLTTYYPELEKHCYSYKEAKAKYHNKIFEAVGVALYHNLSTPVL